jgi:protein TonB
VRKEAAAETVVLAFPARGPGILPPMPSERPARPAIERGPFRLALVLSLALHAAALASLQRWTENDLERALGGAVLPAAEGTMVMIPVEIVADSALPSARAPANATAPEAKTPAPAELRDPERPKFEPAEPVRSPPAAEAPAAEIVAAPKPVETPPETPKLAEPKPQPEPKPEAKPAAPSAAASPARPAASATPGRAGNRGLIETGATALVSSYQAQVLAHLQRHRSYPEEARSRGITGTAVVHFALGRDGRVLALSLARSSGSSLLDEAALAMVRRAAPFPPFPPGLNLPRMELGAPLRFDLR